MEVLTLVTVCLGFLTLNVIGGRTPSGLYHDDGTGHTVLTQRFSQNDIDELSYELLHIMGFSHRPHPHLVETKSGGSQFLQEVYDSVSKSQDDLNVDLSNGEHGRAMEWISRKTLHNLTWSQFNVNDIEVDAISMADSIISFQNRGHRYASRLPNFELDKQLWFDVSDVSSFDQVISAELRLWKKSMSLAYFKQSETMDLNSEILRISVFSVGFNNDARYLERTELDEIVSGKWEQGWLRLNVTNAFKNWVQSPSENFGVLISTKNADSGEEVKFENTGLSSVMDAEEHQPFIVAFMKDSPSGKNKEVLPGLTKRAPRVARSTHRKGKRNRHRRNRKSKRPKYDDAISKTKSCQLGMLYVNFADLNWQDWIIAPEQYIAYYCHGQCNFPLTASMNATNHAIVSTLVHTYHPDSYPKPSCVPVKLGLISMLYYNDSGNVTVKKYKDMVVKSCGCK